MDKKTKKKTNKKGGKMKTTLKKINLKVDSGNPASITLKEGATVESLKGRLQKEGSLSNSLNYSISVNGAPAEDSRVIKKADFVSFSTVKTAAA